MSEDSVFRHTPYDGTSQPFTVGLKPIDERDWLEVDPGLTWQLAEKERLFQGARDAVFQAEAQTAAAQKEVLDLVVGHLQRHGGRSHRVEGQAVALLEAGRTVSLGSGPELLTAARLVPEDLVLMRPGPDGYRLAAAALCFPSSWSLAEKFGQSMTAIHDSVPGFNGSRMGRMVARIFDNLKTDQVLCRYNWSIYPDGNLHHPEPRQIQLTQDENALARLFLRVERQTLRRLPASGDILFTIRIHHDPLVVLVGQTDRKQIAAGLRGQLLALDQAQLAYKGLVATRDGLAAALASVSD